MNNIKRDFSYVFSFKINIFALDVNIIIMNEINRIKAVLAEQEQVNS